jgi:hypothetical protein
MRHIAALPEDKVPRDAEFKFRERSDVLVKKWHQILNATKGGANGESSVFKSCWLHLCWSAFAVRHRCCSGPRARPHVREAGEFEERHTLAPLIPFNPYD